MNKKLLAAFLAITIPIWFIPVGLVLIFCAVIMTAYEFILEVLNGNPQSNCNGFCGEYECIENQENCKRKAQE